jgi:hypothetical protein
MIRKHSQSIKKRNFYNPSIQVFFQMAILLSCLLWHVFTTWYRSEISLGTIIFLLICNSWLMSFVIMIHVLIDIGYKYLLSLCEGFLPKSNNQTVRSFKNLIVRFLVRFHLILRPIFWPGCFSLTNKLPLHKEVFRIEQSSIQYRQLNRF